MELFPGAAADLRLINRISISVGVHFKGRFRRRQREIDVTSYLIHIL